jgi:hypothetical protein
MVFPKRVKLDMNKFIVDHQEVDGLINSMLLEGSCEEMHQKICVNIRDFFSKKDVHLIACKCTIKPAENANAAYMQYVYLENKDSAFVLSAID